MRHLPEWRIHLVADKLEWGRLSDKQRPNYLRSLYNPKPIAARKPDV
jgi:hypothetical protein